MKPARHLRKSILIAWCFSGVATPLGAEIAYRATVLPLVLEGDIDHFRMNDQGDVVWTSRVVVGGSGIHKIYRNTTNIFSPPGEGETEGRVKQIISPGGLIDINSSGHFVTSGKDAGHLWTSAFSTFPHPSRPRVLLTRLSESDSVYGTIYMTSSQRIEGDSIIVTSPDPVYKGFFQNSHLSADGTTILGLSKDSFYGSQTEAIWKTILFPYCAPCWRIRIHDLDWEVFQATIQFL